METAENPPGRPADGLAAPVRRQEPTRALRARQGRSQRFGLRARVLGMDVVHAHNGENTACLAFKILPDWDVAMPDSWPVTCNNCQRFLAGEAQ
jgi:hypothetical protein